MSTEDPTLLLRLKVLLRDVHPAVWRRIRLTDGLSIADLHRVIQLLMGWDDDHLHRFRIHGRDFGVAYIGGPSFGEDAAAVPLSHFGFRPTERFLYEYDFTSGWQIEVRVESVIPLAPGENHRIPICVAGRGPSPPDGCGGLGPMRSGVAMRSTGRWRPTWTRSLPSSAVSLMVMTPFWRIPRRSRTLNRPYPAYRPGNPFWPTRSHAPRSTPHCGRCSPQCGVPHDPDGDTGRLH
ncbi:MAG: hypothetical protein QOG25_3831 [Acetobacteraceae bacterium]|jgi:hypothetical protein|nr:hypothetical protein [Acetobacteraceae bacterium]